MRKQHEVNTIVIFFFVEIVVDSMLVEMQSTPYCIICMQGLTEHTNTSSKLYSKKKILAMIPEVVKVILNLNILNR